MASAKQLAARKKFVAMVKNKKTKVGKSAAKKSTGKKKKLNPGLAKFLAKKKATKKGK
jgi:hypothetical protein